jgi:hypothetical protein
MLIFNLTIIFVLFYFHSYLHNHPKVAIITNSKKRKLDDTTGTDGLDGEDNENIQQNKKQKKNFFTDNLVVPVQQLFESVKSAVTSSFGWFFSRSTTKNIDPVKSGDEDNAFKMEVEVVKTEPEPELAPTLNEPVNTVATTAPSIAHLPYSEQVKYTV